jgi:hypothetical protein
MTQLKQVSANGMLKDINDNFAAIAPIGSVNGLGITFDWAGEDSAGVDNKAAGAHGTGVILPDNAIVWGGFVDVITPPTSGGAATIAVSLQSANDIISAAAVAGAPWSTAGIKAIVPKTNTPESTGIKLTADREITVTVASEVLTAGKFSGYIEYVEGL